VVTGAAQVEPGDSTAVRLARGRIAAVVKTWQTHR
jgi:hypothetical protein